MFGYVIAQKSELKMREYYKYKAYYCGLCKVLRDKYGLAGQMTLTYDMTFLIVLLTSLYESKNRQEEFRCVVHPLKKQKMLTNEITEYAADMNIALSYLKLRDNWEDDGSVLSLTASAGLKNAYERVVLSYPRQCGAMQRALEALHRCESENREDPDGAAGTFAEIMAEVFVVQELQKLIDESK